MKNFSSLILDTSFRLLVPFTFVYGIYALINGDESPGGGFQAGALLAIGVILSRLVQEENALYDIKGNTAVLLAVFGVFIYAAVGIITLIFGGNYLEYSFLPIPVENASELHAYGILGIELGVTLCVMATIIGIFDALTSEGDEV